MGSVNNLRHSLHSSDSQGRTWLEIAKVPLIFFSFYLFHFRGVMKVDINLQKVDIDQCSSDGWFSGTHKCHLNNSEVRVQG